MILGISTSTFTIFHVALSVAGILLGIIAVAGMLISSKLEAWTALFLVSTVVTSATGFLFPAASFTPAQGVGIVSLVVLAIALFALYGRRLAGPWRWIYVASAVLALYLNVFVAVVQAFQKVPLLQPLAPTQSEPPFLVAQLAVIAIFVVLGILAAIRFHPETAKPA
jgi:hypothetical protein